MTTNRRTSPNRKAITALIDRLGIRLPEPEASSLIDHSCAVVSEMAGELADWRENHAENTNIYVAFHAFTQQVLDLFRSGVVFRDAQIAAIRADLDKGDGRKTQESLVSDALPLRLRDGIVSGLLTRNGELDGF